MNGQQKHQITNFLEDKREHSGHSTHVSMSHPKGKFRLGRKDYDTLFELLKARKRGDERLGVAESPVGEYLPILVDVDLKVKESSLSYDDDDKIPEMRCLYTEEQIQELVEVYQRVLKDICGDNVDDEKLKVVLLEKPMYRQIVGGVSYIKNGFHLHFPFLFLDKKYIRVHLIPRVHAWLSDRGLFDDIGLTNSIDIIDKSVIVNPWLMYGCTKEGDDMKPYKVSGVYTSTRSFITFTAAFSSSVVFNSDEDEVDLSADNAEDHIARILSIRPNHRPISEIRPNLAPPAYLKDDIPETVDLSNAHSDMFSNPVKDLAEARETMQFLASHRAETYSDWMKVGWICMNISGGSREGFELWNDFSKQSVKYDEGECLDKWNNSMVRRLKPGLGSLIYFAKTDNPEGYAAWRKTKNENRVMDAIQTGGTHNDLARMMFSMFRTKFRCSSVSSKTWYQFIDHAWQAMEEGTYLRAKISDPEDGLVGCFMKAIEKQRTVLASESDEAAKKMHEHRIKELYKINLNLKDSAYKNKVMRECMEVFYDSKFPGLLNTNKMLVAFENGVYDLNENVFRDGMPEDYISIKMPTAYRHFNRADDAVKHVERFLMQVFPDPSVRKYFLDVYCEIFEGGNRRKIMLMWTGDGDNAKSVTQSLLEKLLGPLAIKFETTLLSGAKTKMGNAAPEMARAKPPVRHATMDEPDGDEKLNCGKMKMLTGGDSYWARDLYAKGADVMEITPMFTLTMLCNNLPQWRHADKAAWNRIRVIPFESNFVGPEISCPDSFEEQLKMKRFPVDRSFNDKVPGMLEALAWYLLQHRAGWPDDNGNRTEFPSPAPEKVRRATIEYERKNDAVRQFLSVEYEECAGGKINGDVMWEGFKDWWKANHAGSAEMQVKDAESFYKKLSLIWGPPISTSMIKCLKSSFWAGYKSVSRMRMAEEDDDYD